MECSLRQRRRRAQGRGQQRAGAGKAQKCRRPRRHRSRRGRRLPSSRATATARSWLRTGRLWRRWSSGDLAVSPRSALCLRGCMAGLPRFVLSPEQTQPWQDTPAGIMKPLGATGAKDLPEDMHAALEVLRMGPLYAVGHAGAALQLGCVCILLFLLGISLPLMRLVLCAGGRHAQACAAIQGSSLPCAPLSQALSGHSLRPRQSKCSLRQVMRSSTPSAHPGCLLHRPHPFFRFSHCRLCTLYLRILQCRAGQIRGFWMPKIKDRAYVVFASEEEAEATRNAVSGIEWPVGNGNSLRPK